MPKRTRPMRKALVIDDSAFFRNLIAPLLGAANWQVTTAADGNEALKLREAGEVFDLIVSDIEMPGMDGLALANEVRVRSALAERADDRSFGAHQRGRRRRRARRPASSTISASPTRRIWRQI